MSRKTILDALGLTNREQFRKSHLVPALEQGVIEKCSCLTSPTVAANVTA